MNIPVPSFNEQAHNLNLGPQGTEQFVTNLSISGKYCMCVSLYIYKYTV